MNNEERMLTDKEKLIAYLENAIDWVRQAPEGRLIGLEPVLQHHSKHSKHSRYGTPGGWCEVHMSGEEAIQVRATYRILVPKSENS